MHALKFGHIISKYFNFTVLWETVGQSYKAVGIYFFRAHCTSFLD